MNLFARFWNWIKRMFMVNHLSGFGGGDGRASTLTFVNSGVYSQDSAGVNTINVPSDALAGDLAVYVDMTYTASTLDSKVLVSGWTELAYVAGLSSNYPRMLIAAKILASGDVGAALSGNSITGASSPRRRSICLVFRPNATLTSFSLLGSAGTEGTTGNPSAQTISVSGATLPFVAIGAFAANSNVTTRSMSPEGTEVSAGGANLLLYAKYNVKNAGDSPAGYTVDKDDNGGNTLASLLLQVA